MSDGRVERLERMVRAGREQFEVLRDIILEQSGEVHALRVALLEAIRHIAPENSRQRLREALTEAHEAHHSLAKGGDKRAQAVRQVLDTLAKELG